MSVNLIQATFTRGQLSRELHSRVDIDHYRQGLALASNWLVMRHGGLTKRPGTVHVGTTLYPGRTSVLLPFVFSNTQAYVLEFGHLYVGFWTSAGQVGEELSSPGGGGVFIPYRVSTGYTESDLQNIQIAQSGDAVYISCEGHKPKKLIRHDETDWTIADVVFQDGPYLREDAGETRFTPASTGAVHPKMTSNTSPSGTVANSAAGVDAWRAFDGTNYPPTPIDGRGGWYSFTFDAGVEKVADAYWVVSSGAFPETAPATWTFEGKDSGGSWVVLDERTNETGWGRAERRYFEFVNTAAYSAYRLNWTSNDGHDQSNVTEIGIHERAENQTPFNLTANSLANINGGSGFVSSDVGRSIRLYGGDGVWRWAKIAARSSAYVVTVRLYGHALPSTAKISRWQLSAFSDYSGYPSAVGFFKERLGWAATEQHPRSVWLSKSANYENYGVSDPSVADDGISVTVTGGRLNKINWISEGEDCLIGTSGSMRTLGPATASAAFSAQNVDQNIQSNIGAKAIYPVMVQRMAVFADSYGRRLYEYGPDPNSASGAYATPELTILSSDMFEPGIKVMAFQLTPFNVIWSVMSDGSMIATTYERGQQVVGSTPVTLAGGSVESATVIPGETGDVLFLVVRRVIGGTTTRTIEKLAAPYDGISVGLNDAVYVDSALSYDGAATSTVSGAAHIAGETVRVFADGEDIGTAVVSEAGEVTLPGGRSASRVTIGREIVAEGHTLRLPTAGNRDGSGLSRAQNVGTVLVDVMDTAGLMVGPVGREEPLRARMNDDAGTGRLVTGAFRVPVSGSWRDGGVISFRSVSAYPAKIRSFTIEVEGEP